MLTRIAKVLSSTVLALGALAGGIAHADGVPMQLAHQGRLYGVDGFPATGTVSVTYGLYTQASGGNAIWSEKESQKLDDGYFSSVLGDGTTITPDLFSGEQVFLSVTINGEELLPRTKLVSVPYAIVSSDAIGDIHPRSITIGDKMIVDENGTWVGDTTGMQGAQGPQGPAGPAGAAGSQGPMGATGPMGPAGADGATGPTGADGPMGPMGPMGLMGPIGPVGPQGARGLACWDANENSTCDLDSEDHDASGTCTVADCVGAIGPQGPQGPHGPAGADGAMGPQGPAGADGAIGPQGPAGADGAIGPQGPAGAAGPEGPQGKTGEQGPQGPAGLDGATGPMGPQGPAGADGAIGPQGPAGADGATGPQGPAGADGAAGPEGPQGKPGEQGPQGPAGADGATGPQGPAGLDGATGPMGPQGPAGLNGIDGATGPMGPQGPAGLDGATGPMGPQGPAGLNGIDGATGPMGPQGPAGPPGSSGGNIFGLPHMVSGHAAPGGSSVSYYSPSAYAYGETTAHAATSLYVPSGCWAMVFVKSTMDTPVTYQLRTVTPVSSTESMPTDVLANCGVGSFGDECVMSGWVPGGTFITLEAVQMIAMTGSFYTSMTCSSEVL